MICNKCKKDVMNLFNNECIECFGEPDSIVDAVVKKFKNRSHNGIKKYGTTLDRDDLTTLEWLNHLQEELMDAILYCQKLKNELTRLPNRD